MSTSLCVGVTVKICTVLVESGTVAVNAFSNYSSILRLHILKTTYNIFTSFTSFVSWNKHLHCFADVVDKRNKATEREHKLCNNCARITKNIDIAKTVCVERKGEFCRGSSYRSLVLISLRQTGGLQTQHDRTVQLTRHCPVACPIFSFINQSINQDAITCRRLLSVVIRDKTEPCYSNHLYTAVPQTPICSRFWKFQNRHKIPVHPDHPSVS